MTRRSFTATEDAFILAHYAKARIKDIASALGRVSGSVTSRSQTLAAKGLLDLSTRVYQPAWTDDAEEYLAEHWGRLPDIQVARYLGRTVSACENKAKRLGVARSANIYTARAVGRLFGVDPKTVVTWAERGWIKARRSGYQVGRHLAWSVDDQSLERFVRTHGWAYDWRRMEEGEYLSRLARQVARDDPWLSANEAAKWLGLSRRTVDHWRELGELPWKFRPKPVHGGHWHGSVVIRRRDLEEFQSRYAELVRARHSAAAKGRCDRYGVVILRRSA